MKRFANIFWFLWCGAHEKATQAGAFGLFGAGVAFYFDVSKIFKDAVWVMAVVFTVLTLVFLLTILRVGRNHHPMTVDKDTGWPKRVTKPDLRAELRVFRSLRL